MSEEPPLVLYIASSGRSGTTLLGGLLGQIEGFFYAGEVNNLWKRGLIENRLCGCGKRFSECAVWGEILETAFSGHSPDSAWMNRMRIRNAGKANLALSFIPGSRQLSLHLLDGYPDALKSVYQAIHKVTGCNVIVDSSGAPAYGRLLDLLESFDLRVIHLVRDPRGVVYSWTRRKLHQVDQGRQILMPRRGTLRASLGWLGRNVLIQGRWARSARPYSRLRYEDLVETPSAALQTVLRNIGLRGRTEGFISESVTQVESQHSISGNPSRFDTGRVLLKLDDEYRRSLSVWRWVVSTLLTLPLLVQFGYPIARE